MASRRSNGKSLVIVESPAKARTINKYLGDDFVVKASMGHVRDLPQRGFGIDTTENFRPTYEILPNRLKVIDELRKLAGKADEVYLATDLDREGEAIAWHLSEALQLPADRVKRVMFNEITKGAVEEAFRHPHSLDLDRVNAQQTRRILDRIVGYELSPLLWRKIAKGLSAGRVQSVAVRLIVEREREIRAFVPEESWKLVAYLSATPDKLAALDGEWARIDHDESTNKDIQRWLAAHSCFRAELVEIAGQSSADFASSTSGSTATTPEQAALSVAEALGLEIERVERNPWEDYKHLGLEQVRVLGRLERGRVPRLSISNLETKRTTTRPPAPFTTSTLQQQASTQLRFNASRTMRVAQMLYEGVDLKGEGPVGLITYMRTDSTNLSREAVAHVRELIHSTYGERYLPSEPNVYGTKSARAQEAHEAIRPTDPQRTPESLRAALNDEQYRLYDVIWRRFVSCQMTPAEWDSTSVSVTAETRLGPARFAGNGRKLVFDGFMKVAGISSEDQLLPALELRQPVGLLDLDALQQYTSPPPRFSEASLVKMLESEGIGRPSTYATIIDTIQDRGYVEQEERKFFPTALGEVVTDKLVEHFPKILDVKFTSFMEDELDKIEESHLDWVHVLHEFYDPFRELLARAGDAMEPARSQPSSHKCPQCGSEMVYRWSKTGRFLACSRYPDCKATINVDRAGNPVVAEVTDVACTRCGKPMLRRKSKRGPFLGCSGYPECSNTIPCDSDGNPLREITEEDAKQPCDQCGEGTLVVKWKRGSAFLGCDKYPKCKNTGKLQPGVYVKRPPAPPPEEAGVKCEKCSRPMVIRSGSRGKFVACSGFPRCRNAKPIEKLEALRSESPMAIGSLAQQQAAEGGRKRSRGKAASTKTAGLHATGAQTSDSKSRGGKNRATADAAGKFDLTQLGEPPPGFAWTRTGRPVVEVLPPENKLNCPECGTILQLRRGPFGPFFSCSGFPKCKFTANLRGEAKKQADELLPAPARPKPILTDLPCDECGKPLVLREGRTGKFLGCSGYPKCRTTKQLPPGFDVSKYANSESAAELAKAR